ncbi:hypothetical protein HYV57_02890 [Candidatus Peregrinibacteria bacterium]|nr:hypothetical protein [Candidatus Peregrinibacteria bacterium]
MTRFRNERQHRKPSDEDKDKDKDEDYISPDERYRRLVERASVQSAQIVATQEKDEKLKSEINRTSEETVLRIRYLMETGDLSKGQRRELRGLKASTRKTLDREGYFGAARHLGRAEWRMMRKNPTSNPITALKREYPSRNDQTSPSRYCRKNIAKTMNSECPATAPNEGPIKEEPIRESRSEKVRYIAQLREGDEITISEYGEEKKFKYVRLSLMNRNTLEVRDDRGIISYIDIKDIKIPKTFSPQSPSFSLRSFLENPFRFMNQL